MKLRSVTTPKLAPVVEPVAEHDPSFEIIGIQPTTVQRLIQRSRDIAAQCVDYTLEKRLGLERVAGNLLAVA